MGKTKIFNERLLKNVVAINSVYPNEDKLGNCLSDFLSGEGLKVKRQYIDRGRFNLFAEKGEGKNATLFYGHLDTVPFSNEGWKTNPLRLTKRGKSYHGLGAYDMKGGIVAFISAVLASDCYAKILLAVDEENVSEGSWRALENNGFFKDVDLVISVEPNFGNGINSITTRRTGRVLFQVDFVGKPIHIAEFRRGVDAIKLMSEFIVKLYSERERLFKDEKTVVQARCVNALANGMSVCGLASLELEVLLGSGDSLESVKERLQDLTEFKICLKPRKTPYLEGYEFLDIPHEGIISEVINKVSGKSMKVISRSSVGDDNVLAKLGIPVITWGPDGTNAHTANENVSVSSLDKLSEMFFMFLQKKRGL